MRKELAAAAFAALLVMGLAWPAPAKTFRFANDGDVNSMDPYARNETFLLTFMSNIYEPLIRRGKSLEVRARARHRMVAGLARGLALQAASGRQVP